MVDKFGVPADLATFGDAAARKNSGVGSLADTLTRTTPYRNDIITLPAAPGFSSAAATTPPITDVGKMFRAVIADPKP